MSETESHFHPCPGCQSAVECQLEIGDADCGKLRCDSCSSSTAMEKDYRKHCNLINEGYICTLTKGHGGNEHIAHTSSPERIVHRWPIGAEPDETADDSEEDEPDEEDEEEAETCDNCGEDITPENSAREFDGEDMCKRCYPECSSCEEELADDNDEWSRCNSCSDYICKDCRWWCHCCEVYMCKGCANNGDHGISQGD